MEAKRGGRQHPAGETYRNLALRAALTGHNGTTLLFNPRDTEDRLRAVRHGLTFDPDLGRKRYNYFSRGLLRRVQAAFPPIHGREGHA